MKIIGLAVGLFVAFATLAAADLSDPGDLDIGGDGTFGGSVSVVSTTFNAVGYNWPSSQGQADSLLQNDGAGGLSWQASGGWEVTASREFAGSSSEHFYLQPGRKHQIFFSIFDETASPGTTLRLRFNGDTATKYQYAVHAFDYAGNSYYTGGYGSQMELNPAANNPRADPFTGSFFVIPSTCNTRVGVVGQAYYRYENNGRAHNTTYAGEYVGTATISTVQFYLGAGTMNGAVTVLRLN
ncbi:hypothetical protein ACFL2T_04470 [Elusimicrobiota bacterium]